MSPQTREAQPSGGDGLLFSIAASVVAIVSFEAVFLAYPSWWLLVLVLLSAILATCGIVFVLLRTIDGDTRIGLPQSRVKETAPVAPRSSAQPIRPAARAAAGH